MSTFVLIPGAGTRGSAWDSTAAILREHGHETVCVELPYENRDAALPQYVEAAREQVGDRRELVVVGQSMGAFTAVGLAAASDARGLVLVCPMIPAPGETPGQWWEATGFEQQSELPPASEWDEATMNAIFLNDASPEVIEAAAVHFSDEPTRIFDEPLAIDAWPDVPTRVIAGARDRFFPPAFVARVSRERLGIEPEPIDSGHVPMVTRPAELAELLLRSP